MLAERPEADRPGPAVPHAIQSPPSGRPLVGSDGGQPAAADGRDRLELAVIADRAAVADPDCRPPAPIPVQGVDPVGPAGDCDGPYCPGIVRVHCRHAAQRNVAACFGRRGHHPGMARPAQHDRAARVEERRADGPRLTAGDSHAVQRYLRPGVWRLRQAPAVAVPVLDQRPQHCLRVLFLTDRPRVARRARRDAQQSREPVARHARCGHQ